MLDDEFTMNKVQEALDDANDVSTLLDPLATTLPSTNIHHIMTRAINQIVFVPHLNEMTQFRWIQHLKVVYIQKKPGPISPSD